MVAAAGWYSARTTQHPGRVLAAADACGAAAYFAELRRRLAAQLPLKPCAADIASLDCAHAPGGLVRPFFLPHVTGFVKPRQLKMSTTHLDVWQIVRGRNMLEQFSTMS